MIIRCLDKLSSFLLWERWHQSLLHSVSLPSVDRLKLILTVERSRNFISSAEPSSLMAPPVQSDISTLKSSPVFTSATGGMRGCQRLWRGNFCSHGFFVKSTGTSSLGVGGAMDESVEEPRVWDCCCGLTGLTQWHYLDKGDWTLMHGTHWQ